MGNERNDEPREHRVQRYFDGEMSLPERVAFEASMTDADREELAVLAEMRALIQGTLDTEAAGFDIAAAVEARLAADPPAQPAPVAGAATVARRLRDPGPRRRSRARAFFGTSAGLLVAAAAAFLFVVRPWTPAHPSTSCDVEQLEVSGAQAMVLTVPDDHVGEETTLIWAEED